MTPTRGPTVVTRHCPAKLNLSLAVLARRTDGFHDIESLMVPVDLADTLTLTSGGAPGIRLAVCFALLTFAEIFGKNVFSFSSDGDMEDEEWQRACEYYQDVTGKKPITESIN